jgi:hypothetical protein
MQQPNDAPRAIAWWLVADACEQALDVEGLSGGDARYLRRIGQAAGEAASGTPTVASPRREDLGVDADEDLDVDENLATRSWHRVLDALEDALEDELPAYHRGVLARLHVAVAPWAGERPLTLPQDLTLGYYSRTAAEHFHGLERLRESAIVLGEGGVYTLGLRGAIPQVLQGNGILTIAELRGLDDRQLRALHGIGPKSVKAIRTALKSYVQADREDH